MIKATFARGVLASAAPLHHANKRSASQLFNEEAPNCIIGLVNMKITQIRPTPRPLLGIRILRYTHKNTGNQRIRSSTFSRQPGLRSSELWLQSCDRPKCFSEDRFWRIPEILMQSQKSWVGSCEKMINHCASSTARTRSTHPNPMKP